MGCANPARELSDIALLYVGGESLTADLADAWAVGRWMENGYGPTECTVTALRGRVRAGQPVTIGRPVRGCEAFIVDESLNEVGAGETGELCIGGPCEARGYRGRDELTAERFPVHARLGRIYRTGDLARRLPSGEFECLGRIDGQVKLRGYRIELAAIESKLAECPGVRAAACAVQGEGVQAALAAHIVPVTVEHVPSVEALSAQLRTSLPEYMIPTRFAVTVQLPTTIGGKLDRKQLPVIDASARGGKREITTPRDAREEVVFDAFRRTLSIAGAFSVHDDFFLDLGGDSLSAVGVVLELRKSADVAVRDLYDARTVAHLAERLGDAREARANPSVEYVPRGRPMLSTTIQCTWIVLMLSVAGAGAYVAIFELLPLLLRDLAPIAAAAVGAALAMFALLMYLPVSVIATVLLKRALVGRYQPARVPAWNGMFTRHWIVTTAARAIPWWLVEGTTLSAVILRALGARIGERVHIHRGVDLWRGGWDLLTIGDDVTLAQDAAIRTVELNDGHLVLGAISIGSGATIDVHSGISPDSEVGRDAYLTSLSWLPSGARIPDGELWDGVPAQRVGISPERPALTRDARLAPALHAVVILGGRAVGWLLALGAPLVAVTYLWTDLPRWLEAPALTFAGLTAVSLCAALSLGVILLLQVLVMRASGRVREGVVSHWSLDGIRIWAKTGTLESAGNWLAGSVFWPWWLQMAGMRIGDDCEISTIIDVLPETLSIGDKSFFADGIYLATLASPRNCDDRADRAGSVKHFSAITYGHCGRSSMARRPLRRRTTAPDPLRRSRPQSAWFGHPPIELPRREVVSADPRLTFRPGPVRAVRSHGSSGSCFGSRCRCCRSLWRASGIRD